MRFLRKKHGFTLIELMIVIAIITILMNITITRIVTAREKAQFEACNSNLKNIATAMEMYHKKKNQYPAYNRVWVSELQNEKVLENVPVCPLAKSKKMANSSVLSVAYAEEQKPEQNSYQYEAARGYQSYRIYCSGDNRKTPHKNGKDIAGSKEETYNWPQYSNVSGLVVGLVFTEDGSREIALLDGVVSIDFSGWIANLNPGDHSKIPGTDYNTVCLGNNEVLILNTGIKGHISDYATFDGKIWKLNTGSSEIQNLANQLGVSVDNFRLVSAADAGRNGFDSAERLTWTSNNGGSGERIGTSTAVNPGKDGGDHIYDINAVGGVGGISASGHLSSISPVLIIDK